MLEPLLKRIIRENGPISVEQFMGLCLGHPEHGYYMKKDPFGAQGDFTTAPEISQLFGEMIGLWLIALWQIKGAPSSFNLIELGPGRGTLMADILRTAQISPSFRKALTPYLVEMSPHLKSMQQHKLAGEDARWISFDALPDGPSFFIANEFFDALPIRQFQKQGDIWREKQIGLKEDQLVFQYSEPRALPYLTPYQHEKDGAIIEYSEASYKASQAIGAHISQHGGAALFIDYGEWDGIGDTFQALHRNMPVSPLAHLGDADLTAHVKFSLLANAATPLWSAPLVPQGVFLEQLGITERAQNLAKNMNEDALEAHIAAHRRLTHPKEMGSLFKCLFLTDSPQPTMPGFAL